MADDRLRELERRAQASGDPADEGRLLKVRLRAGLLAQDRLRLAAYCGHQDSLAMLGTVCPLCEIAGGGGHLSEAVACPWCHTNTAHPQGHNSFDAWIRNFGVFGRTARVRVSLAALMAVLECWSTTTTRNWYPSQAQATSATNVADAIEEWLRCPCDRHIHAWDRCWRAAQQQPWCPPVWDGVVWIFAAANHVEVKPVRDVILRDVGGWALSDPAFTSSGA